MTPARAIVLALACLYIQVGATFWIWLRVTGTRPPMRLVLFWLPALFGWDSWDEGYSPPDDR